MIDEDYNNRFGGIARLYGTAACEILHRSHVVVIGIGGVGCWAVEALARVGIGEISLVDMDEVCINNTNRQLHAMDGEIGRAKIDVMGDRVKAINPNCKLNLIHNFFMKSTAEEILGAQSGKNVDYVLDCIDSVKSKCYLLYYCRRNKIPIVSCGGAGGRVDPTKIQIKDMARVRNDPLCAKVRKILRNEYNFPKNPKRRFRIPTVFSPEDVVYPQADGTVCSVKGDNEGGMKLDCNSGYGTASYITGTFAFLASSHLVQKLISPDPKPNN